MLRCAIFVLLLMPLLALQARAESCPEFPDHLRYDTGASVEVLGYGDAGEGSVTLRHRTEGSGREIDETLWAGILRLSTLRSGQREVFEWQSEFPPLRALKPGFSMEAEARVSMPDSPPRLIGAKVKVLAFGQVDVGGCRYDALKVEVRQYESDRLIRTETSWISPVSFTILQGEQLEPEGARYMHEAYQAL